MKRGVTLRAAVLLLAVAAVCSTALATELPDLEVTDLWDYPENLRDIVARGNTLFFICDPEVKECREGAVFIETRESSIYEAGLKLVLLFQGAPAEVRRAALDMDLDSDIYIDEDGQVIDAILDEGILPAILLVSQDGTVLDAVYGGGESLAGNIDQILQPETPQPPPAQVAQSEKEKSGKWKWAVAAMAVITIGAIILAVD
jgi:hypothetical protein